MCIRDRVSTQSTGLKICKGMMKASFCVLFFALCAVMAIKPLRNAHTLEIPAKECTLGEVKKVECNTCTCNDLGDGRTQFVCTEMLCFPGHGDNEKRSETDECELGATKAEDCNTCFCKQAGPRAVWVCTQRACVGLNNVLSANY
eukprot:TRINITY_DN6731_c0_g1_i1.p1 TRINITY_DN6731_c0_g1~~TRINITY_DN6731_c0_g1_i1.p1  ORF type:complete len:145 (-),score=6.89 TRINITY_DN6731_c0_g1_i1:35-469(-)